METKILFILTLVSCCLQIATVRSHPTSREHRGVVSPDGNTTLSGWSPQSQQQGERVASLCRSYSRTQLIRKLNKLGRKSSEVYGGYNRRYMAITWTEARQFPSLVATVSVAPQNTSTNQNLPERAPSQASSITSASNCNSAENGLTRMCKACSTVTFLGDDIIPAYINEVTCGQTTCAWGLGLCKNAVMLQQFLYKTGRCDPNTGYEEMLPYTQPIRVCCECMLVPF